MNKTKPVYFQDLPEDYQDAIFLALRDGEGQYEPICSQELSLEARDEAVDDWLNRNNNPETIKKLVNEICLN